LAFEAGTGSLPDEEVRDGLAPSDDPEPLLVLVAVFSLGDEVGFPVLSEVPVEAPSPFSEPVRTFLSRLSVL
jgi:hypothetical protein